MDFVLAVRHMGGLKLSYVSLVWLYAIAFVAINGFKSANF